MALNYVKDGTPMIYMPEGCGSTTTRLDISGSGYLIAIIRNATNDVGVEITIDGVTILNGYVVSSGLFLMFRFETSLVVETTDDYHNILYSLD